MMMKYIWPVYEKYGEQIRYLFFGFLTTVVNLATFWILINAVKMDALVANVIAWIVGVVFAYTVNRIWVFGSTDSGVFREAMAFAGGRLFTLGAEEMILWFGIDVLDINAMFIKVIAQIVVVVGNYVISKWFVFRRRRS